MKIVGLKKLENFMKKHARSGKSLKPWMKEAELANWQTPQDIRNRYNSADFLSNNRVVFNIGGNNYRLVIVVIYTGKIIHIDRIGTHAEYDQWKLS
ncbi:MAG: mRNA interferase HigB [Rubritalea sp.]|jgi:mRNA interferase HigB